MVGKIDSGPGCDSAPIGLAFAIKEKEMRTLLGSVIATVIVLSPLAAFGQAATPVDEPAATPAQHATASPRAVAQTTDSNSAPAPTQDSGPKVTLGGFVDTYYAWDFDRPNDFQRAYTTQPVRHAEFNVNLAYLEAKLSGPRYHGRLALQYGTSVQANYAGEPHLGSVSGPSVSQFIQEATVGYQISPSLWLDGGIFFAHLGYEGWISRDNLTYSRSMVAEFSPYYEAGAKLTWVVSPTLKATFALINGWQDISVYNTPPAGGVRVEYSPTSKLTLSYDDFVGNATADGDPVHLRVYHDLIAEYKLSDRLQLAAIISLGTQTRSTASGNTAVWGGGAVVAKFSATETIAVVGRVEYYSDPSQVIVVTALPASFEAIGGSLGVDINLFGPVFWRTEGRILHSRNAVWPLHTAGAIGPNDSFVVTSLSITL
jgi:hypothetical protein